MSLKVCIPAGRTTYYLRGTVRAGKKSRSVYETTGVGAGEPGATTRAEEIRLRREGEIYNELLYGAAAVKTFIEAAADYADVRNRRRIAGNPALAGQPDKEIEYVIKWVNFLRARRVADIPLNEFVESSKRHLAAYFDEMHIAKGNSLSTMQREATVFCTIMNHAVAQRWISEYERPNLPEYDITEQPVNKWLYAEEIALLIRKAPKHLKLFVAGVFATGIRGGELLFVPRRLPNYQRPDGAGISMEPGHEHIFLGFSKSKRPIFRTIPDWYAEMIQESLEKRVDSHDALFLADDGKPYKRPKKQTGFVVKTAWKAMRERAAIVIERLASQKAHQGDAAAALRLRSRAAIIRTVTPHWGRHNAASHLTMRGFSDRHVQKAGGWLSPRMLKRYQHLSPEHAKDLANELEFGMASRAKNVQVKKAG